MFYNMSTQPETRKLHQACCRLVTLLDQANIRMRLHRFSLLRLVDNKSAASCQQTCCKLITETFYSQAWCKLFQQLIASLQISSCNKSDFRRLSVTWWIQQACCKLITETFYSQAWCKLFQQLIASLQISSCNKSDFRRLSATWWIQQACCKLITETFYSQAWCKLFQQLIASLQISSCNKSDFHRLSVTWWIQQTFCNLLATSSKPVKSTTCSKSVAFLAVWWA